MTKVGTKFVYLSDTGACNFCDLTSADMVGCLECYNDKVCSRCDKEEYFADQFRRGKCRRFSERCPHNEGSYSPVKEGLVSTVLQRVCLTCPLNCKKCFDFTAPNKICSECFQPAGIAQIETNGQCSCLKSNCLTCERYDCDKCDPDSGTVLTLAVSTNILDDHPSFSCQIKTPGSSCNLISPYYVASSFSATDPENDYFCYDAGLTSCDLLPGNRCDESAPTSGNDIHLRSKNLTQQDQANPIYDYNTNEASNCNQLNFKYTTYKIGGNKQCQAVTPPEGGIGCLAKNITNDCQTCEGEAVPVRLDSMRYTCGCPLGKYYDSGDSICKPCIAKCDICENERECQKCRLYDQILPDLTCKCKDDVNCKYCPIQDGSEVCFECLNGYWLEEEHCVTECSEGYLQTTEGGIDKCLPCKVTDCKQQSLILTGKVCPDLDSTTCNECKGDKYLSAVKDSCDDVCSSGFYQTSETGKNACAACLEKCDDCKEISICLQCDTSSFLKSDKKSCLDKCPDGEYVSNQVLRGCSSCPGPKCKSCDTANPATCLQCSDGSYLTPNGICICVSECPSGMLPNDSDWTCQGCSVENCDNCEGNLNKCRKCQNGLFLSLDKTQCSNSCNEGEVENPVVDNKCISCPLNAGLKPLTEIDVNSPEDLTNLCGPCLLEGCFSCLEDMNKCCLNHGPSCVLCDLSSDYYTHFASCDRCWVNENQQSECPTASSFEPAQTELEKSLGAVEILISPPLTENLSDDEIDQVDFASIFKIQEFEGDIDSPEDLKDVEITKAEYTFNKDGEGSSIKLTYNPESLSSLKLKITLATGEGKFIVYETSPKIRKDQKLTYLANNQFEIKLLEPKEEESVQLIGADKFVATTLSSNDGIIGGLTLADPTGTTVKASQMIKVLNKFIFLDIEYGKNMRPFLEQCAKIDQIGDQKHDEVLYSGFKHKFSRYKIGLTLSGPVLVNTVVYLVSWIFKIIELVMISKLRGKKEMPTKKFKMIFNLVRKLKFSLFCSYAPKVLFFGMRVLFHSKTIPSQLVAKFLISISLMLIPVDFYLLYYNIMMIIKHGPSKAPEEKPKAQKSDKLDDSRINLNSVLPADNSNLGELDSDDGEEEKEMEDDGQDGNIDTYKRKVFKEQEALKLDIDITKGFSKKFKMNNKNFFRKHRKKVPTKSGRSRSKNVWLNGLKYGDVQRRKLTKEQKKDLKKYDEEFKNLRFPKDMSKLREHREKLEQRKLKNEQNLKKQKNEENEEKISEKEIRLEINRMIELDESMAAFNSSNMQKGNKAAIASLMSNFFFFFKTSLSQMLIVANPTTPQITLSLMLLLETIQFMLNIYSQFWLKSFLSGIVIIQRVAQNIGLVLIIALLLVLKRRIRMDLDTQSLEKGVKISIVCVVLIEYSLCILLVSVTLLKDHCKKKKKNKTKPKIEGEQ